MAPSIRDLLGDQGGTRHNKLSKVLNAIGVRGGEPVHQRMALVVAIEEFARNHASSSVKNRYSGQVLVSETLGAVE